MDSHHVSASSAASPDRQHGTAIITGGARGTGSAIAAELAALYSHVAILDVCERENAGPVLNNIRDAGAEAFWFQADVAKRTQVEAAFGVLDNAAPPLAVLVNNATVNRRKPLLDLEPEDVAYVWDVQLWGSFHCTQLAARRMVEHGGGNIVTITSVHARVAFPGNTAYDGAKAALTQMTRTWAAELAPYGVRVNAVEPGWIDTPGERLYLSEAEIQERAAALPFRRLGRPAEVARAVGFLVSDAAAYITGTCLTIDGGITLRADPA